MKKGTNQMYAKKGLFTSQRRVLKESVIKSVLTNKTSAYKFPKWHCLNWSL